MITLSPEELAGLIAKAVAQGVTAALSEVQRAPAETAKQARNRRHYEKKKALVAVTESEVGVGAGSQPTSDVCQSLSDGGVSDSVAFQSDSDGAHGVVFFAPSPSSLSPTPPISPPPPAFSPVCTGEVAVAVMKHDTVAEPDAAERLGSAQRLGFPDRLRAPDELAVAAQVGFGFAAEVAAEGESRGSKKPKKPAGKAAFSPPSLDVMLAYAASLDPPLPAMEVEVAWNFYESKGWRVGNQGMRDWQAALRSWKGRWMKEGDQGRLTKSVTTKGKIYGSTAAASTHRSISHRSDSANRPGRYA